MATSGEYNFSLTTNEAIAEAFDLLGQGVDDESLGGASLTRGLRSANLMLKAWQGQGIHLWTYKEGTLFLRVGQSKYDFRLAATHIANTWYETTTTAATTAAALSFAVTAATDIQKDDIIGIIDADNDLFWTTVNRVDSLTVYVDDNITAATVSGTPVYNYRPTTATVPDLIPVARVLDVRRRENSDYEIPIIFESRKDYFNLPNKSQNGTVIQTHYARDDVAGEDSGTMFTWSAPANATPVLNFTYERKLQVLEDSDDTLDMPDTALEAFTANLAYRLMLKYGGVSKEKAMEIKAHSIASLNDFLAFDNEPHPIALDMRMN